MKIPCKVCGKEQERERNPSKGCICPECKTEKIRAYHKTEKYKSYRKTEKYKAYQRAYRKPVEPLIEKFSKTLSPKTAKAFVLDGECLEKRLEELKKESVKDD